MKGTVYFYLSTPFFAWCFNNYAELTGFIMIGGVVYALWVTGGTFVKEGDEGTSLDWEAWDDEE